MTDNDAICDESTGARRDAGDDPDRMPLADALSRGLYGHGRPPRERQRWPVESLDESQREALSELVEAWWPQQAVRELVVATGSGWEVDPGALSVVLAAAAIAPPLSAERWTDIFGSGALTWPGGQVAEWLRETYTSDCRAEAVVIIRGIQDGRHLLLAATALGEIDSEVGDLLLERARSIADATYLGEVLRSVTTEGHIDAVRAALTSETDPLRQRVYQRVLAAHGDVDAQLALIDVLIKSAQATERMDRSLLDWYAAAHDERLVEPLGELLALSGDAPNPTDDIQRAVRMALAATRSERVIEIYDRLAIDPDRPERAFQWYPREELARQLATEEVLGRLPESPTALLSLMHGLGFSR